MQTVLLTGAGGPETLQLSEQPLPELPGSGYIRVRLHAAGLNPVDCKLRGRGGYFPDRLPAILGCDGAGVVDAAGSAVTRFKIGDAVYFFNGGIGADDPGNYAEYAVIHQDYAAHKPKNLSMIEAAAVPLALITAWESLFERVKLQAGENLLIHAGAGGVGHLAIQLAKNAGARVAVTVSSEEKAEFTRALGADCCIDYTRTDFTRAVLDWTNGNGADLIFDTVGGETFCRSFAAARVYGAVVTLLETPCDGNAVKLAKLRNLSINYELMLTPMLLGMHEARMTQRIILENAASLFEHGRLQVKVSQVLPLAEIAEAHRLMEAGHSMGKIVLQIQAP
ncbi:MAG: zinc-dependent alcohol dehydrogenase family protein [Gammaproteobacteria bacterium]|nr:zinc-dependent alcohol dehydrogenase family protein [Gammaproteobacteria bacterium]